MDAAIIGTQVLLELLNLGEKARPTKVNYQHLQLWRAARCTLQCRLPHKQGCNPHAQQVHGVEFAAYVPLREVLGASSLSELHCQLARRAAHNALDGSIKTPDRVFKANGYCVSISVAVPISEIVLLRSSIVHQGRSLTKEAAAIEEYFSAYTRF
nr:hypothetical protein [Xanthomonas pisi]